MEEQNIAKEDCSDHHVNPCKRKFVDRDEQIQKSVDNSSKFKKAKHPWQIKGISIERNIISQEVRMNEDDPQQMVGVIKYEEKGILSVNLSTQNAHQEMSFKQDRGKSSTHSTWGSHEDIHSSRIHPSTSTERLESSIVFNSMDNSNQQIGNSNPGSENMCTNDSPEPSTVRCFEEESQGSMDHEMSSSGSQRERNSVADIFPTLNFQQCVWQKREMGCAIVDNVFNKTLEEMGLSPDPKINKFATDRLHVMQQSIDAAINTQGLHAQHSRYNYMDQSQDVGGNESSEETKPVQEQVMKRRLSLEDMPSAKVTFKRRLSQPLSACELINKERQNMDNELTVDANECNDNLDITCEEQIAINNNYADAKDQSDAAMFMNITEGQYSSLPVRSQDVISSENKTEEIRTYPVDWKEEGSSEQSSKYIPESENLMDLAVSTAIKSQGLSLN